MKNLWEAHLFPQSPRYSEWLAILDGNEVPIASPSEHETELGDTKTSVYRLDTTRLSEQQRNRLINAIAAKFGAEPSEVRAEIAKNGHIFPIRCEDVTVVYSLRAFL